MRLRRAGKTVKHAIAVGELLTDDRHPPTVVVAGLLDDVLEDTDVSARPLKRTASGQAQTA
jgi:(p)ppGpp synthase/HD superfamily hydrolase